jgi:arylsulfatase A-like enzyme
VREYAFAEHNWRDYEAAERAVRSDRFTYIRNWLPQLTQSRPADVVRSPTYQQMRQMHNSGSLDPSHVHPFLTPRPPEELYDVDADPESLHNLASDPNHAATLRRLRGALENWQRETADEIKPGRLSPDRFDRFTGEPLSKPGAR